MQILIPLFLAVYAMLLSTGLRAQGFKAPEDGKSVVYFTRVSSYGALIPFDFFDGHTFIGDFAGKKYLRHECQPGEHLFWASSENKAFITANLEAGKSYVVIVDVDMGIGMARVGLTPIGVKDKVFLRARSLIEKKAPVNISKTRLASENERLAEFIREKLRKYEETWSHELTIKHLSPDMAIDPQIVVLPEISH